MLCRPIETLQNVTQVVRDNFIGNRTLKDGQAHAKLYKADFKAESTSECRVTAPCDRTNDVS
jgi:hypothetical protein